MTTRFEDIPALLDGLARLPPERPALTFYKGKTRAGALDVRRAARRGRSIRPHGCGTSSACAAGRSGRRPLAEPAGGPGAVSGGHAARRRRRPAQPDHPARGLGLHPRALGGASRLRRARAARPPRQPAPTSSAPSRTKRRPAMSTVARRRGCGASSGEVAGEAAGDRPLHLRNHRQPEGGRARPGEPARQRLEHGAQLSVRGRDPARGAAALPRARAAASA